MLVYLFWAAVFSVVYTYLLYPALLWLLTLRKRAPQHPTPAEWPSVSLVLAAYNEIAVIREKIENTLSLDYPTDRLEFIVVSDCSDDGTDEAVAEYADRGVKFHRLQEHGGKTMGQNAGARLTSGEILIFSDANSIYAPDALKELVRPFADPKIGCVCGELRYANPDQLAAGKGEGFYWRYEQFLKRRESLLTSTLGANGSIYALRRELFDELGPEIISDFIMPIRVWCKGFRVVYESRAVAVEHSGARFRDEFRRRTRIISRSAYSLWTEAGVLNPFAHGFFAFQLFSHKLLRWLVPLFMIAILIGAALLAADPLYQFLLGLQLLFYLLAILGNLFQRQLGSLGLFYIPAYFCATNFGALLGLWNFLTGRRYQVWQTASRE
jgi:cellulose synthase/poly-beta-1,6-N-acetylglucosamine synthase-like glycosyltransferase